MSVERVKKYLEKFNKDKDVLVLGKSTATVQLAAEALGIIPARIAKTIALKSKDSKAIIVVTAGDTRVDNKKFREQFDVKASMLSPDDAKEITGYAVGGVCPFDLPEDVTLALDESLKRFESVYPACGSSNSAIEMTLTELEKVMPKVFWVDVCKDWKIN